jgi:hypothetical protein
MAAKGVPNGYVYKIEGGYTENEFTPAGAIVGAYQVDGNGNIIPGSFRENPNYDPSIKGKRFKNVNEYRLWQESEKLHKKQDK